MTTWRWLLFSVLILVAATLLAAVLTPPLREQVRERLHQAEREVLATAEGDVLNTGQTAKVVKYRSYEGIFVEVYKMEMEGHSTLVDRMALPDRHDGLFNYQGHVTRLAIADVDQDGKMELLAPTFDNQLIPHLNVFKYNSDLNRFELSGPLKN